MLQNPIDIGGLILISVIGIYLIYRIFKPIFIAISFLGGLYIITIAAEKFYDDIGYDVLKDNDYFKIMLHYWNTSEIKNFFMKNKTINLDQSIILDENNGNQLFKWIFDKKNN